MTTQIPVMGGICPRETGGQAWKRCTLSGPTVFGMPGPPSGVQVSRCDQSLIFFFFFCKSSVSQSSRQGLRWWVTVQRLSDQGELPHVQQHWSHTQVEICHGLVAAHLRLCLVFDSAHARGECTCVSLTVSASVNIQACKTCKYVLDKNCRKKNEIPDTHVFLFSSLRNQKQMCACLQGLFKPATWKIYGRVFNLIVRVLLLEKDRWGPIRDMFYQFVRVSLEVS